MVINRAMKRVNVRRDANNARTLVNIAKQYLPTRSHNINMLAYNRYSYSVEQRIKKIIEDLYKLS